MYTDKNLPCPSYIADDDSIDEFALATLLEAGGIPDGSLDSTLNPAVVSSEYCFH